MALTETVLIGGARHTYQRKVVKTAQILDIDPTGSEIVVAVCKTDEFRRKSIEWVNRSASNAHTVKIYGTLKRGMPSALADEDVHEVASQSVALGTSEILTYADDYYWMIITMNGTAETDKADCYLMFSSE